MPRFVGTFRAPEPTATPTPTASSLSIFDFVGSLDGAASMPPLDVQCPAPEPAVASAKATRESVPPYHQLHMRLQWLSSITTSSLDSAFSKGELAAVLRRHSIYVSSSKRKDEYALELMKLISAGGLARPDQGPGKGPGSSAALQRAAPAAPPAPAARRDADGGDDDETQPPVGWTGFSDDDHSLCGSQTEPARLDEDSPTPGRPGPAEPSQPPAAASRPAPPMAPSQRTATAHAPACVATHTARQPSAPATPLLVACDAQQQPASGSAVEMAWRPARRMAKPAETAAAPAMHPPAAPPPVAPRRTPAPPPLQAAPSPAAAAVPPPRQPAPPHGKPAPPSPRQPAPSPRQPAPSPHAEPRGAESPRARAETTRPLAPAAAAAAAATIQLSAKEDELMKALHHAASLRPSWPSFEALRLDFDLMPRLGATAHGTPYPSAAASIVPPPLTASSLRQPQGPAGRPSGSTGALRAATRDPPATTAAPRPAPPRPAPPRAAPATPTAQAQSEMVAKVSRLVRGATAEQVEAALSACAFNLSRATDMVRATVKASAAAAASASAAAAAARWDLAHRSPGAAPAAPAAPTPAASADERKAQSVPSPDSTALCETRQGQSSRPQPRPVATTPIQMRFVNCLGESMMMSRRGGGDGPRGGGVGGVGGGDDGASSGSDTELSEHESDEASEEMRIDGGPIPSRMEVG